jgi:hypothetical protein
MRTQKYYMGEPVSEFPSTRCREATCPYCHQPLKNTVPSRINEIARHLSARLRRLDPGNWRLSATHDESLDAWKLTWDFGTGGVNYMISASNLDQMIRPNLVSMAEDILLNIHMTRCKVDADYCVRHARHTTALAPGL